MHGLDQGEGEEEELNSNEEEGISKIKGDETRFKVRKSKLILKFRKSEFK